MPASILVGYATRSGSTKEIAEAIAAALREAGGQVDLRPMKEVSSLEGYRSVVLGAPLYMFHWHKDALGFLTRHHDVLAKLPVVIFALGPFHDEEKEWQEVRRQIAGELAKLSMAHSGCPGGVRGEVRPDKAPLSHDTRPRAQEDARKRYSGLGCNPRLGGQAGRPTIDTPWQQQTAPGKDSIKRAAQRFSTTSPRTSSST